ncbi:MAG: hypothetical protein ACK5QT_07905 [Oligoflexia bacterium]
MFDAHLFICTNRKAEGKPSCAPKGSEELRERVKQAASRVTQTYPNARIRVNASGCLGQCQQGIAAVCYPSGAWLTGLENDAASESACLKVIQSALNAQTT